MSRIQGIASSALQAFGQKLRATAHNLANLNNPDASSQQVSMSELPDGGVRATQQSVDRVDLSREVVNLIEVEHGFNANLAVIKQEDEQTEALLDILA